MQEYIAFSRLQSDFGLFSSSKREKELDVNAKPPHSGLDGRSRDRDGEIRHKNGNTRIDTLRNTYGDAFASGVRGDMHLDTLLDRSGARSLREYLKNNGR
jgi:DUF4097 and DUF4098 domain-containing protein YvlB